MRKLVLIAAMLMASASAHAGNFSFNVEGQKVQRQHSARLFLAVVHQRHRPRPDATSSRTRKTPRRPLHRPPPRPRLPRHRLRRPRHRLPRPAPTAAPQTSSRITALTAPDGRCHLRACRFRAVPDCAGTLPCSRPRAPAPVQVAAAPAPTAPAPAAVQTATSPLGVWMTEKKEGKVRIEDCDGNLCGYSVDAKTGANGAKVLINMKPQWRQVGRPHQGHPFRQHLQLHHRAARQRQAQSPGVRLRRDVLRRRDLDPSSSNASRVQFVPQLAPLRRGFFLCRRPCGAPEPGAGRHHINKYASH